MKISVSVVLGVVGGRAYNETYVSSPQQLVSGRIASHRLDGVLILPFTEDGVSRKRDSEMSRTLHTNTNILS